MIHVERNSLSKYLDVRKNVEPIMSEKREKFVRLAEGRTRTALDAIRKIGNLSNKRAYEYDEQDVKKITRALREATNDLERKFTSSTGGEPEAFKL
jgi:hypothetical protein